MAVASALITRRGGIYLRISRTDDDLAVRRHEQVCRKMAADLNVSVVKVYIDNNVSAWSRKPRKDYQRMLADLQSGKINMVFAFAADRLHRSSEENIGFLRLAAETGFICHTYSGGPLDYATEGGKLLSKMQADIAEYESGVKSERARSKMSELRRAGKFMGGRRAFGLTKGRIDLVPEEAALVRRAAADVLAGKKLYAVTQEWNAAGVTTVNGNEWDTTKLRELLLKPWARGFTTDGTRAEWPALIDGTTARRLDLLLDDPSRRRTRPEQKQHLLTSLLVCGRDGCTGRLAHGTNNGKASYRCKACHRCAVIAADVEEDVSGRVLARIDMVKLGQVTAMPSTSGADDEALSALEAEADELVDMLGAGELDRAGYRRARERLDGRMAVVKAGMRRDLEAERRSALVGGAVQLSSRWADIDMGAKRAIIDVFVDRITVAPALRGRARYDDGRVTVGWL